MRAVGRTGDVEDGEITIDQPAKLEFGESLDGMRGVSLTAEPIGAGPLAMANVPIAFSMIASVPTRSVGNQGNYHVVEC